MKRHLSLVAVLILCCASLAFAQQATPSPSASPAPKPGMTRAQSQKLIVSTERKLWEAWKSKDLKPFKTHLAADSVMIGDAGVANKAESLKELETMGCDVKSYELSDIKVTFLNNDAALITYKAMQDGTCGGQAVPPTVWASSAYVKRGGKWFAASHQETPAKK
jgi:Domain of unknown function (DUF4440)